MVDLDDAEDLAVRDNGRLLAIVRAGATVRRVAAEPTWAGFQNLNGAEVGSLGVLSSELLAAPYGEALAELGIRLGAPIAAAMPTLEPTGIFPRAADVVLIVSVNGLERRLLDGLHLSASRGALTVVVAPEGSPIAVAAAERHVASIAFEDDDAATAWWAAVATLAASMRGVDALAELADALDDAAAELGPVQQTFRNPAKQIALLDGPLLVVALDGDAALAAPVLTQEIGMRSSWSVRSVDARHSYAALLQYVDARGSGGADDLFFDPQIDGPDAAAPARQLVLLSGANDPATAGDALQIAERIGAVRAVPFGRNARWNAVVLTLLAQLSGSYHALAND